MKSRLLIVDDDEAIRISLEERFAARGFVVTTASDGDKAIEAARKRPDLMLLDLQMPGRDGIEVLRAVREFDDAMTVIVITAHGTVDRAVEAMKAGAYDFIEKPFDPARIEEAVGRANERAKLQRAHRAHRDAQPGPDLVVADPRMQAQLEIAKKAAASDATVLITGESGTGKEMVAREVHAWSSRCDEPMVAVNCVALAESLLESELFGHEKGAFTGANERRRGRIELAHRGTLFLDEIGDISGAFQAKLLRVLQERSFERVGGHESIEVDVRVVAATNRDLKAAVQAGEFREDLYYRLNVIEVHLPPLRERPGDLLALAEHFAATTGARAGLRAELSEAAKARLTAHKWPGNVRELRNAIERALVMCDDAVITCDDLPPEVIAEAELPPEGFHARVEAYRKKLIQDALDQCGGVRTKAAELLGLQRTYLARLMRQYDLR